MVSLIDELRLEIRKHWDVAHDFKCNKRCDCESFGRTGKRCKYPLPEILKNETTDTADFDDRQTGSNSPHE